MEIRVLGCSGGRAPGFELTSLLVDERLLVDTGGAASGLDLAQQESIDDVLVTHAHLDHILGLAFILQNTKNSRTRPMNVYATGPVIRVIKEHLLVPDVLPEAEGGLSGLEFHPVSFEIPFRVGVYEAEAFQVLHTPGACAFRISDSEHTFFFTGDTGPTDRIWKWLKKNGADCLAAEVSFPNNMQELADASRHLTPASLAEALERAEVYPSDKVYVTHLKPAFLGELMDEIEAERNWNLMVLRKGDVIRLGNKGVQVLQPYIEERVRDQVIEFDSREDLYDQRSRLAGRLGVHARTGEVLFQQGETSKIMYIIMDGKVRISRRVWSGEKTLAILGPGDFFGEMAMLNNRPRSATAKAVSDTHLLAFDRRAFEKLLSDNFGVALKIIRTLSQRLEAADAMIENLLIADPVSKVINTLIQFSGDEGMETDEGLQIRTSPEDLAERSGVVIATLRNILADLARDNMILARKETIIIPSVKKLKRLMRFLELQDEFSSPGMNVPR